MYSLNEGCAVSQRQNQEQQGMQTHAVTNCLHMLSEMMFY